MRLAEPRQMWDHEYQTEPKMSPAHASLPEALTKVPPLENGDRLTRAEFERRPGLEPGALEGAEQQRAGGGARLAQDQGRRRQLGEPDPALDGVIPPDARIEKVAEGFSFGEGPVWDPEGSLLFSDPNENLIYRWSADEGVSVGSAEHPSARGAFGAPGAAGEHDRSSIAHDTGPDEALQLLGAKGSSIDLLLTDAVLRGGSGQSLAARAKALRPELPVVFMSGYAHDTLARQGILNPGVILIQKPFTGSALARKLREVLDER